MKLYTKTGDDGSTGLYNGQRVGKDTLRIAATGDVDELNSALGIAACACAFEELSRVIRRAQHHLFDLGADLASPPRQGQTEAVPRIGPDEVRQIERDIDEACLPLEEMRHFILPGGTELAARLHLARTVCRRAERTVVTLSRVEPVAIDAVVYLNRLSDLLFALARRANQLAGVADVPWLSSVRERRT